jgi:hypothetical protein
MTLPQSTIIDSIDSVLRLVTQFGRKVVSPLRLRGQTDRNWSLLPSIGREDQYWYAGTAIHKFTPEQEKNMFHKFRRQAAEFIHPPQSEWDLLFLARHHGLPVRLLDWTSNPLVALYHCCLHHKAPAPDGAIWALREKSNDTYLDILDPNGPGPFETEGLRVVHHPYTSTRMRAQASVFTIHECPDKPLDEFFAEDPNPCDIEALAEWVVPGEHKSLLLAELHRLGVSGRSVFPDLDGLAAGIWQTECLRQVG